MLPPAYSLCADACRDCINACEACMELVGDSVRADAGHCLDLCRSSIRMCRLVIEELELRSGMASQVSALCAVICRACAEECETWQGRAWDACMAACQRAAAECHAVATQPRGAGTDLAAFDTRG
jgi:hypothetical protein